MRHQLTNSELQTEQEALARKDLPWAASEVAANPEKQGLSSVLGLRQLMSLTEWLTNNDSVRSVAFILPRLAISTSFWSWSLARNSTPNVTYGSNFIFIMLDVRCWLVPPEQLQFIRVSTRSILKSSSTTPTRRGAATTFALALRPCPSFSGARRRL